MPPTFNPLGVISEKRQTYEHLKATLIACGRSLLECGCWHYDADRLGSVSSIGSHIQETAIAMQALLEDIQAIEQRMLGA